MITKVKETANIWRTDQSKEEVKQFQVDKRGRLEGMEETIPDK